MIRYALQCVADHTFEAWFSNSEAFDRQKQMSLVECPKCGSHDVRKQIMAPAVVESGGRRERSPEAAMAEIAGEVRQRIASTHEYVGDRFATEARAMYYGDIEHRPVWGKVTPDTARELMEEGVPAAPLPAPFAPEPPKADKELN